MKLYLTLISFFLFYQCFAQDTANMTVEQKMIAAKEYFTGVGKPKNKALAVSLYLDCANKGNVRAMNMMGYFYGNGVAVVQNKSLAIEWLTKAGIAGFAESWYHLGMVYKDEKLQAPDYVTAYLFFSKAAQMGNVMGIYSQGYMHYKGLGCIQDYTKASQLFKVGVQKENANSMYFLGLCYRNGYGVALNNDSATYWLQKAADKGYLKATNELGSAAPENSNPEANRISNKLKADAANISGRTNQYIRVESQVSANLIQGKYTGYIIRYDWSGKHAINSSKLELDITCKNGEVIGIWKEADTLSIPFYAELTPTAMVFKNTSYSRKDHYSNNRSIEYKFQNADLQWIQNDEKISLVGNVQMFSPKRNEPEKPLFISLTKKISNTVDDRKNNLINMQIPTGIKAYPSPFNDHITIEFFIKEKCNVVTEIFTADGKEVYSNPAGVLETGYYKLPVNSNDFVPGLYILKVQMGKGVLVTRIIKN